MFVGEEGPWVRKRCKEGKVGGICAECLGNKEYDGFTVPIICHSSGASLIQRLYQ